MDDDRSSADRLDAVSDDELVRAYLKSDGESPEAERLLLEMERRGIDF